ncbi:MAG: alpha/beta hydrolase [Pseudomonadota bacterium]
MSIRASVVSMVLKHTIRKQMSTFEEPAALREQMSRSTGKPPADVTVKPVSVDGVPAEWLAAEGAAEDAALLYLHGGGYVFGGPDSHRDVAARLAKETKLRVLLIDYRLAPEHPFPAAVEDATTAYRFLLAEGYPPERLLLAGDSAGGGLAMALMVNLKDLELPLPRAAALISPWVDMTLLAESLLGNADKDVMLSPEAINRFATHYLKGQDPRSPLASPLHADLAGMPPVYVVVGSTEVLLSDSESLVAKLTEAGSDAELVVWPKMPHAFPVLSSLIPEGRQAIGNIGAFLAARL